MKIRSASILRPVGFVVLWLFAASPATAALAARTWVSGIGDDANPCTRTTPCKTFAGAIAKTAAGGEIDALDPGEYGSVDITQSVTIDGGAEMAKILVPTNRTGVNIFASSYDTVTLRNLTLQSLSPGTGTGIDIVGGRNVLIEHCAVFGTRNGIAFTPVFGMSLMVSDTTVENAVEGGIWVNPGGTNLYFARMTATRVRLDGNGWGLVVRDNCLVFVSDSSASNNRIDGFIVHPQFGGAAELDLENVSSSNNGNTGAVAYNSGSVIRLSNVTIDHNGGAGVVPLAGGLILSFGNNRFAANVGGDGTINGPAVAK